MRLAKPRYAILLDGGFVKKKLLTHSGRHPTADDIVAKCEALQALPQVADHELLRIYYYDAFPAAQTLRKAVSRTAYSTAETDRYRQSQSLFDQLVLKPNFALRMGQVGISPHHWKLKDSVSRQLVRAPRPLTDDDFVVDAQQKGVDMRIGMDMARLALRDMVRQIVVVTGDSDFVPAFKFVRREGVRVILDMMGENGRVELKQNSDIVL
jgi:uncharacterized LabA/DUF88 family protein